MPDNNDGFWDSVTIGAFLERCNFARGFCGPNCEFIRTIDEFLTMPAYPGLAAAVDSAFVTLDKEIGAGHCNNQDADATISSRWLGLSCLVRAQIGDRNQSESFVKRGKKHFDQAWDKAAESFKADWESAPCSDASAAKGAERVLFARFGSALSPWTPGSWMAWDVLCQLNKTGNPLAVEKSNVLFGRADGGIMKLVVEVLPGPAQLVTPNWWRLGMTAISTTAADANFLGAMQRAMTLAAPLDRGRRLRWHLEASEQSLWQNVLHGRSGESAAACAAMAVFELLNEVKSSKNITTLPEPVLDDKSAVSAAIGNKGSGDFFDRPLVPVEKDTLPTKFVAARNAGVEVIALAVGQPMDGVAIPDGIRVELVPTIGEAFDLLRAFNRAIERYRDHVRSQFRYSEEETPDEE